MRGKMMRSILRQPEDAKRPSLFWRATTVFVILSQLLLADSAMAQVSTPSIVAVSVAPSGACTANMPLKLFVPSGVLYSCQNGTYGVAGGAVGAVTSVFTRTGAVVATTGDYTAAQVTNALDLSNVGTQTMQGNLLMASGRSISTGILRDTGGTAAMTFSGNRATFSNGFNVTPVTIAFSATPAITTAGLQTITLTGNAVPTITIASGEHLVMQICQDAVGSRTWTWPASVHGGLTIGSTLSTCSQQAFDSFNGTTLVAEDAGISGVAP